jgi:hypothetical protein
MFQRIWHGFLGIGRITPAFERIHADVDDCKQNQGFV